MLVSFITITYIQSCYICLISQKTIHFEEEIKKKASFNKHSNVPQQSLAILTQPVKTVDSNPQLCFIDFYWSPLILLKGDILRICVRKEVHYRIIFTIGLRAKQVVSFSFFHRKVTNFAQVSVRTTTISIIH